jgi:DNA polymerase III subunit epsilon
MNRLAVIDFETTGLSPAMGDRATEVAIVLVEGGQVVGRFQSLMNAGVRISPFIESFTGISNAMVAAAPPAAQVMAEAARFVCGAPMVAHNASFDRKFWQAELARVDMDGDHAFACTLLLARRLYPQAPNHRLGTLAELHTLKNHGRAHRALADAETAAALLAQIQHDLRTRFGVSEPHHSLLVKLQACPRHALRATLQKHMEQACTAQPQAARTPASALAA